mmetsp:Transcript_60488/g.112310  ORF Transcript_60488/g.112310 Transcript_60488/m.112310 type:complete len:198 (-) Transcript_60488:172-765(-)
MGRPAKGDGKDSRESKFAGKEYKDAIMDLLNTTNARQSDFDIKAVQLFDIMQQKGKADEAVAFLKQSLQGVDREKIWNWRAYVYTLLRGFDAESYQAMKDETASSKPAKEKRRGRDKGAGEASREAVVGPFAFNAEAAVFVPGVAWDSKKDAPATEAAETATTADASGSTATDSTPPELPDGATAEAKDTEAEATTS